MLVLDELYKSEVARIVYVQDKLFMYEHFLQLISEILQPSFLVFYMIPLLAALKTCTYIRVMITVVATEYVNLLVKWMVSAYRPYWWVQETIVYKDVRPILRQTRLTCETTAGLPSGHLMYASAILYSLIRELVIELRKRKLDNRRYIRFGVWLTFGFIMIVLTLSRMYFACHFLHQCICGVLLGIGVAELIGDEQLQRKLVELQGKRAMLYAVGLCCVISAFLLLKNLTDSDPQWSIKMGLKWCNNPLFVQPPRTPKSRMSHDFGIIFGLAISAPFSVCYQTALNYRKSLVFIIICVTLHRFMNWYAVPKHVGSVAHFASLFLINLIFPYLYIVIVPKLCAKPENA